VGSIETLTDICLMNPKDLEVFGGFVRAIVVSKLLELGFSNSALVAVDLDLLLSVSLDQYVYILIGLLATVLTGDPTIGLGQSGL
jgi:hypothetical protein